MITKATTRLFTSQISRSRFLIETDELATLIAQGRPSLKIVNGTWYMPNAPNNAAEEHF